MNQPSPDNEDALIVGTAVAVLVVVFVGGLVWFSAVTSEQARTKSVAPTPMATAKEPAG